MANLIYTPDEQLSAIEAISDAYLGQLGVDDVLREITGRLVDLLQVDTAAVLLVDSEGDHLVARAACGIEEEVRQGVRIPLGEGFAGHVAADRRPIILDRVDSSTVANPILLEKGIHALLGVPLMDGGTVIGVLHVGSLTPRAFTADEAGLLQQIATRVTEAVRTRGSEADRVAAQTLQRSLLPSRLPRLNGLQFAARYVPAEVGGVGGDWFDAFQLPTGDIWVMVGDVAGHGLTPAVIMGRLRSALRSYALEGHDPEHVLTLANRKLQFFEPGSLTTVLTAVLSPPYDEIQPASAGHLPPVLAIP
ncbi:MAG: PP2C family protein-serine/threonine phosphatase, partial [Acidimicrobiales bacterium]